MPGRERGGSETRTGRLRRVSNGAYKRCKLRVGVDDLMLSGPFLLLGSTRQGDISNYHFR